MGLSAGQVFRVAGAIRVYRMLRIITACQNFGEGVLAPTVKELLDLAEMCGILSSRATRKRGPGSDLRHLRPSAMADTPGKERMPPALVGAHGGGEVVAEGVPLLHERHENRVVEANRVGVESLLTVRLTDGVREGHGFVNLAPQLTAAQELVVRYAGREVGRC